MFWAEYYVPYYFLLPATVESLDLDGIQAGICKEI